MTIFHDHNEVKNRSEPLGPVLWQGRRWAVTEYGVERRDGLYFIKAGNLGLEPDGYSWIKHIGAKGWEDDDFADFATAFLVACALFRVKLRKTDPQTILKHYKEAARDRSA